MAEGESNFSLGRAQRWKIINGFISTAIFSWVIFCIQHFYLDAWTFLLSFRELSREFADIVESFRDNESACCTLWRTTDNGFSATLKWLWRQNLEKKGVGYVSEEGERNGDKVGEREKKEA